ncbi:MAG: IS3 family transposase [Acidiferrobacterales bacterium]|nr:IS3 family transposase [Acidiferrobacterales bacterium]
MTGCWVKPEIRDAVVALMAYGTERVGLPLKRLLGWLELSPGKYHAWRQRQGQPNRHNAQVPSSHWLLAWEREAIIAFAQQHPLEGYRRLCYLMIDAAVVACAPSTVYRVLKGAGLLNTWEVKSSSKGQGFDQPTAAHQHWHIDIAYLNIAGTFYYLCSVLDGYSRFIVHWALEEAMSTAAVEIVLQAARERVPGATPRVISDNGPQFIARDFKEFIRLCGMTHVKTSPYYPQSNGKLERWHNSLKAEGIRPNSPVSLDDARRIVSRYVDHYNTVRLHSAIGYVTPQAKLDGREEAIFAQRRHRLAQARAARCHAYQRQAAVAA